MGAILPKHIPSQVQQPVISKKITKEDEQEDKDKSSLQKKQETSQLQDFLASNKKILIPSGGLGGIGLIYLLSKLFGAKSAKDSNSPTSTPNSNPSASSNLQQQPPVDPQVFPDSSSLTLPSHPASRSGYTPSASSSPAHSSSTFPASLSTPLLLLSSSASSAITSEQQQDGNNKSLSLPTPQGGGSAVSHQQRPQELNSDIRYLIKNPSCQLTKLQELRALIDNELTECKDSAAANSTSKCTEASDTLNSFLLETLQYPKETPFSIEGLKAKLNLPKNDKTNFESILTKRRDLLSPHQCFSDNANPLIQTDKETCFNAGVNPETDCAKGGQFAVEKFCQANDSQKQKTQDLLDIKSLIASQNPDSTKLNNVLIKSLGNDNPFTTEGLRTIPGISSQDIDSFKRILETRRNSLPQGMCFSDTNNPLSQVNKDECLKAGINPAQGQDCQQRGFLHLLGGQYKNLPACKPNPNQIKLTEIANLPKGYCRPEYKLVSRDDFGRSVIPEWKNIIDPTNAAKCNSLGIDPNQCLTPSIHQDKHYCQPK